MPGDYTRFTYRPQKRHSSVLMQQGRVQLDADSNEQVEILKRRWEIQAKDTFGHAAIPTSIPENATAFRITAINGSDLDLGIGEGRIYVDGLLAEIFENERFKGEAITYLNQPFYPDPQPLSPIQGDADGSVVYLDVWEREITYIQDRGLLEKALSGVDTGTRIQTVWQVKYAPGNCRTVLDTLFPKSAGRLSSRAVPQPASDDPCIISPSAGYRGLENRLYRVEIHNPGSVTEPLESVRFKWSRENASVVSAVEEIVAQGTQSVLTVSRIGRDKVLRFKVDDWVEVLDDDRELMEQPGVMARIVHIDEANRRITLDDNIPTVPNPDGFDVDATDPSRHTRLIRWDQQAVFDPSEGLVAGSDGWIALEDGVEVQLSLEGPGGFHVGDYWVFAARTLDGSVEELDKAPPRGIVHHYCALAPIAIDGTEEGIRVVVGRPDCRHLCAPCGGGEDDGRQGQRPGCCVLVHPGQSPDAIQAALDSLPTTGGCVCLQTGTHNITEPIHISNPNVVLHGASIGARVVGPNHLLLISRVDNVHVHDIVFEVTSPGETSEHIVAQYSHHVTIADCQMVVRPAAPTDQIAALTTAVLIRGCTAVDILGNDMRAVSVGVHGDNSGAVRVCDNTMLRPRAINDPSATVETRGIWVDDSPSDASLDHAWQVERNHIENYAIGISISAMAGRSVVAANVVERAASVQPVTMQALLDPLEVLRSQSGQSSNVVDGRIYAIDVAAPDSVIRDNTVELADPTHGGIRGTGTRTRIEGNRLLSATRAQDHLIPLGIFLGLRTADDGLPNHSVIQGNVLTGQQDGIVVVGRVTRDLENVHVYDNRVENSRLAVALKHTHGTRVLRNHLSNGVYGVAASGKIEQSNIEASENIIENMQGAGLAVGNLAEATITHNRIAWCGYDPETISINIDPLGPVISTAVSAALFVIVGSAVRLESNEILNTGISRAERATTSAAVGIAVVSQHCQIGSNRVAYSAEILPPDWAKEGHRALFLVGLDPEARIGNATIVDNSFSGAGGLHLVELHQPANRSGFEKIIFSNNHCDHTSVQSNEETPASVAATVSFWGQHLIVMGNHVKCTNRNIPSMDFNNSNQPKRVVLMGNITTGAVIDLGNPVPLNHLEFNIIGV